MKKGAMPFGMYQRIEEEINRTGLNCKEIGDRIGCDRKTIYAWRD